MSRFFLVLLYALFYPLVFLHVSAVGHAPWEDYRPFWGGRPGEESVFCLVAHNNQQIAALRIRGAEAWVQEQISRFSSVRQEPNDIDNLFIDRPCTMWRSRARYDLEGTIHQAVQTTFIDMGNGEWLFYLYNFYTQESLDAYPATCSGAGRTMLLTCHPRQRKLDAQRCIC